MNPYDILQVSPDATADEIKRAYRTAVKKYHPDVSGGGHHEMIALVNQAYDLLSDPALISAPKHVFGLVVACADTIER